jgi:hypothetical protein
MKPAPPSDEKEPAKDEESPERDEEEPETFLAHIRAAQLLKRPNSKGLLTIFTVYGQALFFKHQLSSYKWSGPYGAFSKSIDVRHVPEPPRNAPKQHTT